MDTMLTVLTIVSTAAVVAEEVASGAAPPALGFKMLSYQAFAPPKKPSSFGSLNQPSTTFFTPSNTQTAPSQTLRGTSKKLGVLLEK